MPRTGLTPEELKIKALDAAEQIIRISGVERSRLTDIAREVGVSHAALYKHFANKEELLDAVTDRWLHHIDLQLTDIAQGNGSPIQRLRAFFLGLYELKRAKIMSEPKLYEAFNIATAQLRPSVQAHMNHMFDLLQHLIQDAITQQELRPLQENETLLMRCEVLFEGTMAFHHPRLVFENKERDRHPALEAVLSTLLRGFSLDSPLAK
jgi:AcrR family transcriptional regulator